MKHRRTYTAIFSALLLLLTASVAFAVVRIGYDGTHPNTIGGFETAGDVAAWSTLGGGTISGVASPVRTGTGAVSVTIETSGAFTTYDSSCIDLDTPAHPLGMPYRVATGYMYIPSSEAANFRDGRVRLRLFATTDCSGSARSVNGGTINNSLVDQWVQLPQLLDLTQATEHSAVVQIAVRRLNDATTPFVYVDDMYVSDSDPTAVNLQSFNAQNMTNTGIVLVALFVIVSSSVYLFLRKRHI